MLEFYKTRQEAFKLAQKPYEPKDPVYTQYSPIYIAPTSNITDTMKLYKNYNRVLSVGSTGAHGYEAALNGATSVDLFDINELQKLFFKYMNTAIMFLDYETFIKHFTLKRQSRNMAKTELKDLLSNELYYKLVYFLPEDVEFVLSPLYDFFNSVDLIISSLFRFEHIITLDYLKRNVSFYNEEEYYKLQRILRDGKCQINFRTVALNDVPNQFDGKYDLIILDNIFQYYKKMSCMDTPYLVNLFIHKKLSNLLTDEGVIQANYGFEVATDAFKEKFGIPYTKDKLNILKNLIIEQEIKEGINVPLVEKWNNYSYSFIPGVEIIEGRDSDNLVLTYKKNENSKIFIS